MIDKRKYGPKLNEVAQKYADESGAAEKLAKKNQSGRNGRVGRGHHAASSASD